ncbi:MAG TPA: hypothetical protein VGK41_05595 [Solirubrobacterales bacterium]
MQFGFTIAVGAADGLLHVQTPYRDHFTRRDACGCGRCFKGPPPLGTGTFVMDRQGRLQRMS